jgi:hypothetical protein
MGRLVVLDASSKASRSLDFCQKESQSKSKRKRKE